MDNTATILPPEPDYADIQGLIVTGYTHPFSVHMLFEFSNTNKAGIPGFFKALMPYLQSAEDWGPVKPKMMLNIGLTWNGLALLRPDLNPNMFPPAYTQGPDSSQSQISLFDVGPSTPSGWWNGKFKTSAIHCIVHVYAMSPEYQTDIVGIVSGAMEGSGGSVTELLPMETPSGRLEQFPLIPHDFIHFEYRDSIDEPDLGTDPTSTDQQDLNHFLIGYTTPPPNVPSPTVGNEGEFAKNGCYNAFRILYQDVAAFDGYLKAQAVIVAPQIGQSEEFTIEWLAAKLNGRWRNGSPLVLSPDKPNHDTSKSTDFGYENDTQGLKCPFSAHTRVSNPRNESIFTPPEAPVPRLIRRGVPYGPPLDHKTEKDDRGLIGLFLCGDFSTQFEKLYSWINANNFSALFKKGTPQDALIGNRPTSTFNPNGVNKNFIIPIDGKPSITLPALPQFVVTRGTAYTLFPSVSSLKSIAGLV